MIAVEQVPPAERPRRQPNPRGEGVRLRHDIVAAATVLLERTGSEDSISLRAIAREVGIAAPSIGAHFADRAEIIDAVVAKEVGALNEAMAAASAGIDDPVERLFALCRAYYDYGRTYPARYRLLVGRRFVDEWEDQGRTMEETAPLMAAGIATVVDTLQACIDRGASASRDAYFDTVMLWFGLHGLITVPQAITSIDWPDRDRLFDACVTRGAQLAPSRH